MYLLEELKYIQLDDWLTGTRSSKYISLIPLFSYKIDFFPLFSLKVVTLQALQLGFWRSAASPPRVVQRMPMDPRNTSVR